jgi:hypothetical protein
MAFLVYENENGAICFWPGSDVGVGRVSVSPSVQGMHGPSSSNCGHFHLRMTNFGLMDQLRNGSSNSHVQITKTFMSSFEIKV